MATFDENGNYIKTDWKAGDKITAAKLNKIEESIEAVNNNDISRHVEADARLDKLESGVVSDKQAINAKVDALEDVVEANKDAADLEIYRIDAHVTLLDKKIDDGVAEVEAIANTVEGKIAAAESNMQNQVIQCKTDMEAMVAEVEGELDRLQNGVSEIQNDMENAQTQVFNVTNAYKFAVNHDGMMSSLVTLDNIEGLSSIEINDNSGFKFMVSRAINHICIVDTNKNYFDDAMHLGVINNAVVTKEGNSIRISSTSAGDAAMYDVPTLERDKKYCIFCDNVAVVSGDSMIQVQNTKPVDPQTSYLYSTAHLDRSGFDMVFMVNNRMPHITLHCSPLTTGGDVIYENIQIYEVKELTIPDIQLNSLPNGVKDEIKDGMLFKRTNQVNLKDLAWVASSTNVGANDYKVYYTHSVTDIKWTTGHDVNPNTILCNMLPCTSNAGTGGAQDPIPQYQTPGISSHVERSEFRIKVKASDAPDLDSLYTWLNNNNVTVVYEMQSYKYEDVNLTIKADKGDTVVINTSKIMDFTYDIQLNTRAQLNIMQDLVGSHKHAEYLPLSGGTIDGTVLPAVTDTYDLGSDMNRWGSIHSYPFTMYVEDNGYTSRLRSNRGNFRLMDGYDYPVFSWSHDYLCIGPDVNNAVSLGNADYRFKSLYLNSQPNVSSDRTLKENIQYVNSDKSNVSYEDMYAFVKDDLELATYNLVEHDNLSMGFIAQDLLANLDGTDNKVGQMIVNPVPVPTEEEIAEGKPYPTLSFDMGMYTSVLAGALKEAINKIEQLEARINELENK